MTITTPRLALPLLQSGQAQKELFHNEALAALDLLVQPAAETIGDDGPPAAPTVGHSWIVGGAPTGAWSGHAHALASWTDGGWRFAAPAAGMQVWIVADGLWARHDGTGWTTGIVPAAALSIGGVQVVGARRPAIANPVAGTTIDAVARTAIDAILTTLRTHGLIAG